MSLNSPVFFGRNWYNVWCYAIFVFSVLYMHVLFLNALFYMVKFMPLSEVRLYNKKSNAMFSFFFKEHSLIITTIIRFCKKSVVLLLFYIGTFEQMHKSETDDNQQYAMWSFTPCYL